MRIRGKNAGVAALMLLFAAPLYAQVCIESGASSRGKANIRCDMYYRDTLVTCAADAKGVTGSRPSCPETPMPMLDTPKKSYIADFSSTLFAYPRNPEKPSVPYVGPYSIGTPGDASKTMQMTGNSSAGSRRLASCKAKLKFPGDPQDKSTDPRVGRLQTDNCTNEYILNTAISPFRKENPRQISGDDPSKPGDLVSLKTECQPLATMPKSETNEYSPSAYLEAAWQKTLQNPDYRKTTRSFKCVACTKPNMACDREPHLPCGTTIPNKVALPNPFPDVRLSTIAAIPYEEIIDPTHPFSPRWDFLINDREYSKPSRSWSDVPVAAATYAGLSTYMVRPDDAIFCAGVRGTSGTLFSVGATLNGFQSLNFGSLTGNIANSVTNTITNTITNTVTNAINNTINNTMNAIVGGINNSLNGILGGLNLSSLASLANLGNISNLLNGDLLRGLSSLQNINLNEAFKGLDALKNLNFDALKGLTDSTLSSITKLADVNRMLQGVNIAALGNIDSTLKNTLSMLQSADLSKIAGLDLKAFQGLDSTVGNVMKTAQSLNIGTESLMSATNIMSTIQNLGQNATQFLDVTRMADSLKTAGMNITMEQFGGVSKLMQTVNSAGLTASQYAETAQILNKAVSAGVTTLKMDDMSKVVAVAKQLNIPMDQVVKAQELVNMGNQVTGALVAQQAAAKTLLARVQSNATTLITNAMMNSTLEVTNALKASVPDLSKVFNVASIAGQLNLPNMNLSLPDLRNTLNITNMLQGQGIPLSQITNMTNMMGGLAMKGITLPQVADARTVVSGLVSNGISPAQLASSATQMSALGAVLGTNANSPGNEKEIPVDVLEFRRSALEMAVSKRVGYNAACFQHRETMPILYNAAGLQHIPLAACYTATPEPLRGIRYNFYDCWKCFGLNGPIKDKMAPPCAVDYTGKDLNIKSRYKPGGLNAMKRKAWCLGAKAMDSVCSDLRKPFTPLNKLKMRYHNPSDASTVSLKDGPLEGMTFKEYFGKNMPYPRILDMGGSFHKTPISDSNTQSPLDIEGQYAAIVGVGREASPKVASDAAPADRHGKKREEVFTDQRCKLMGWGGAAGSSVAVAGTNVTVPDPMSSWTEFKLYQSRTLRTSGISCIGRYEKVFKHGGAEGMALAKSGAAFAPTVVTKCTRSANGTLENCQYMPYKEYTDAGSPQGDATTAYLVKSRQYTITNPWRGYMVSTRQPSKFPTFNGSPATITGLDNAQEGDIILMPNGPADNTSKPGLAKVAYVSEINTKNCSGGRDCFVKVFEFDNGKFPDICGTTDTWGEQKSRFYYKPGSLPNEAAAEYTKIGAKKDCEETGISACEMSAWDRLKIYRAQDDNPEGCNEENVSDCATR